MQVTHKIDIHLDKNRLIAPVDVMQGDAYTRKLEISLYFAGEKWPVPEGASIVIGYFGASGRGAYNDLPDGSPPYTVADNVITVTLIPQVTAAFGVTYVTVVFMDDTGKQIATFGVPVRAARNAALGAGKPQDHYNLKDWVGAGPFYFNVTSADGVYTADKSYDEIRAEYDAGKETICTLKLVGGETMELPIVKGEAEKCIFSAVCGGIAKQVTITRGANGAAVVAVEDLPPVLLVTVIKYSIDSNIFYEADTTFAAIRQAYDNNRVVVCKQGSIAMPIAAISGSTAIFSSIRTTNIGERMVHECKITKGNQADTITYTENKLAYKDDLRPPLYVTVTGSGSGTADTSVEDIKAAKEQGRTVYCSNGNYTLGLISADASAAVFQLNDGITYRKVVIQSNGTVKVTTGTAVAKSDLKPPLYVTIKGDGTPDTSFETIATAHKNGQPVYCILGDFVLVLSAYKETAVTFQTLHTATHQRLTIYSDNSIYYGTFEYVRKNEPTDEKYFSITSTGVISLKKEYRGASASEKMTDAVSDNGRGLPGSKYRDFPEEIVIPEFINGIPVTAYANGMFHKNNRLKKLTLLSTVTAIPHAFCASCQNLTKIVGTEAVTSIGSSAFSRTAITEARFPKLQIMDPDGDQFMRCANLLVADLGKVITKIPYRCFGACENLATLEGCGNVTELASEALYYTKNLKELPFRANLTSIGSEALYLSRANRDNTPGFISSNIVPQYTGAAKATRLYSTFEQHNPLWAKKYIVNYKSEDGKVSVKRKYETGCVYVSAAIVYSALKEKTMFSPEEFVEEVFEANPELAKQDAGGDPSWEPLRNLVEAMMGYPGTLYEEVNSTSISAVHTALSNGGLVMARIVGDNNKGKDEYGNTVLDPENHFVVFYGITEDGEVMVADSSTSSGRSIGIYEASIYTMPIQNLCRANDVFMIINKPT